MNVEAISKHRDFQEEILVREGVEVVQGMQVFVIAVSIRR